MFLNASLSNDLLQPQCLPRLRSKPASTWHDWQVAFVIIAKHFGSVAVERTCYNRYNPSTPVNEEIPNGSQKHKAEAAEALLDGGDGRKSWGIIGYLE